MTSRIVLFYKHLLDAGGAERLALRELDHLRAFGHDARLLTYRTAPPALFGRHLAGDDIVEVGSGAGGGFPGAVRWVRSFHPDWILSSSGHIDAWALARLAGCPYALHVHHPLFMSLTDRDKYARRYRAHFEALCRGNPHAERFRETARSLGWGERIRLEARAALHHRAVAGARHVLVLSRYAQAEKRVLYGVRAHVLRGALEGRDPAAADRRGARRALAETSAAGPEADPLDASGPGRAPTGGPPLAAGLASDPAGPLVFTVGRLMEAKRIDLLIEAFADALGVIPGALLAIGGVGPDEARLRRVAEGEGVAERVRFLGHLDEEALGRWYEAADVFASLEGADFNLTPLEALERGTPSLVSVGTDLGDDLTASGWLEAVPPERGAAAAGLLRLLERRSSLELAPLRRALEPFRWESYFQEVEALLLGGEAPAARNRGGDSPAEGAVRPMSHRP